MYFKPKNAIFFLIFV